MTARPHAPTSLSVALTALALGCTTAPPTPPTTPDARPPQDALATDAIATDALAADTVGTDGLATDADCGTCPPDEVCVAGACACGPGRADCNGLPDDGCETDTGTDTDHCGACGVACEGTCSRGRCFSRSDGGDGDAGGTDSGTALVCPVFPRNTQRCLSAEGCCATISLHRGCGCAAPRLGTCIPRGSPGCELPGSDP